MNQQPKKKFVKIMGKRVEKKFPKKDEEKPPPKPPRGIPRKKPTEKPPPEDKTKAKPKAKPAPKPAPKPADGKKLVSKMTYDEIVGDNDDDFLFQAEDNVMQTLDYSDFTWLDGITDSMYRFYRNNNYRYDELSEKKRARMDNIYERINDSVRPSLIKELKRAFRDWKKANGDKRMTEKEAIKSFENFYF